VNETVVFGAWLMAAGATLIWLWEMWR